MPHIVAVEQICRSPASTSVRSSATATVDFPEAGSPVSQMVAPRLTRRRPSTATVERGRVPGDIASRLRSRYHFPGVEDSAGADRVVTALVDEDECAAIPVFRIRVGEDDGTGAQRYPADVVESEFGGGVVFVESFRVQSSVRRLHRGGTVREVCFTAMRSPARKGVSPSQHTAASISRAGIGAEASAWALMMRSPRAISMPSASSNDTERGATATERSGSSVSRAVTVLRVPAGNTTTSSPTVRVPADSRPV